MASKIRVMISSRCNDRIQLGGVERAYSDMRRQLKRAIEEERLLGDTAFECWINEDAIPAPGSDDSWNFCLEQVKRADIVIVLYNGHAGWAKGSGDIGICHAEYESALSTGAAKVRIIELPITPTTHDAAETERNQRFMAYYQHQSPFRGSTVTNGDEAIELTKRTLSGAVVDMVKLGVREARKGKYDTGEALDWSRLDFLQRKASMERIVRDTLKGQPDSHEDGVYRYITIRGKQVLFCCHAVPAALNVPAAREMVGRPFHRDHELSALLTLKKIGPVHLIATQKSVTEKQASDLIGFPDATLVKTSFGVYAVDNVQKIQIIILANCRDETSTRHAVQRALEWLERSGESAFLVDRAVGRKSIISVIASVALGKP